MSCIDLKQINYYFNQPRRKEYNLAIFICVQCSYLISNLMVLLIHAYRNISIHWLFKLK